MADLIDQLVGEGHTFGFFQAVSLLEEKYRKESGLDDPIQAGRVRFSSDPSSAFPPEDISRIDTSAAGIRMVLSFMGLTGASSPLPSYFTEYVQQNEETAAALDDFLTVFNNRMYGLFYRAWKKYHFIRNFSVGGADPFSRKVAALAGIDHRYLGQPRVLRLLAYTGVLAGRIRGRAGLEVLLSDFFGGIPVGVQQWVPRWVDIPHPPKVGVNARLGINAVGGTRVRDIAGKFRVVVGPLSRDVYETFLPGSENIAAMKQLVAGYLSDPLHFDIEVRLQSIDLVPVVLGKQEARLGTTSSLGRSEGKSAVQSIVIR